MLKKLLFLVLQNSFSCKGNTSLNLLHWWCTVTSDLSQYWLLCCLICQAILPFLQLTGLCYFIKLLKLTQCTLVLASYICGTKQADTWLMSTICVPFLLCRNLVYVKKWIVSLRYDRLKLIWYDEHQFTFIGWYQESSQWFSTGNDGNHWINIAS